MSSSSSDEENLDLLKEATDTQFMNDDMYKKSEKSREKSAEKTELKSLRRKNDEDEQFNQLNVTPGFRKYVARKLDEFLEKKLLKYVSNELNTDKRTTNKRKGGVKLFKHSEKYIKTSKSELEVINTRREVIKKRTLKFSEDASSDEEVVKIQSAAVSPKDIVSGKDTKYWSNHKKPIIFSYKRSVNGSFEIIENKSK